MIESFVSFVLWLWVFAGIGAALFLWYRAWRWRYVQLHKYVRPVGRSLLSGHHE